jgi:hypothetical protein
MDLLSLHTNNLSPADGVSPLCLPILSHIQGRFLTLPTNKSHLQVGFLTLHYNNVTPAGRTPS